MKVVVPCEAAGLLWLSDEAQWWVVLEIGVSDLLSPPPMLGEPGSHRFQNRGYFCKIKEILPLFFAYIGHIYRNTKYL
jgi:hypothetical protein